MNRTMLIALSFLLLFFAPNLTTAQEPSADTIPAAIAQAKPTRAKIGIALEGGGALGLAHIGVLQWFEDHHIPVDYVAGTSMGGLVGGLYATGKTPKELQEIVEHQDWDLIIGGKVPYQDLSYRRKEDARDYPTFIQFGLKKGLSLPAGLNAGHQINLLIDRETLPYANLKSFDDLPIPYRCVATDLVSGHEVVFSDGSLPQAMRATMSIPGLFIPVRRGDQVLVDGGLVGNLPTDVARKMGADIVIAIHLELAPPKPEELQSLFSVLGQSVELIVRQNEIRGLSAADLVVTVDLHEYTSIDYKKSKIIIDEGRKATESKSRVLEPFSLNDADWKDYLEARSSRRRGANLTPQFIRVAGTNRDAAHHLEDFLHRLVGKPLDTKELDGLLTRLTGIGKYDSIGYQQIQDGNQSGLLVTVHEKSYAPPLLQYASEVDGSEPSDVSSTLAARLTVTDVAGYRSEWRSDILFGGTYGISSELYKPFAAESKWFIAPHASASYSQFKVYQRADPLVIYGRTQASVGADLGYGFNRFAEIRFGYEVGNLDARLRLGTPPFPNIAGRTGSAKLHFLVDHSDDPVIPRRGYTAETTFRWYDTSPGAPQGFPTLDGQLQYFQPITKPASIFVTLQGGTTFSSLTLPPFLGKKIYAIGSYEFAKMYGFPNESGFPNDFNGGVLAETALGPLVIGGSWGDSGHRKWYFQLGRVF